MKHSKKKFWNKGKIIIAITLGIILCVSMFFAISCSKPKFNNNPDLDKINSLASTALPLPTDGSTPGDHDAKDNIYYAFTAMAKLSSFRTESSGTTTAVGITQKIKGSRIIKDDEVYKQNVSASSVAKVGAITYVKNDKHVIQNAKSVESINSVVWSPKAKLVTEEKFLAKYGFIANSITGYVFTDDTILSAQQIGEPVDGIYTFEYKLHTTEATGKIALEMRTMANMKSLPLFSKATLTIKMNSDWLVTQVKTSCSYKVDMLGGVSCTEAVTENFYDYNNVTEIPNAEFYQSFFDTEADNSEDVKEYSALDYIIEGFGAYLSGDKPLKANLSASSPTTSFANAKAEINLNLNDLSDLSVRTEIAELKLGDITVKDLFVGYENDKIYLKTDKFKGFGNVSELLEKFNATASIFNLSISNSIPNLDVNFESILDGATITETDEKVSILIPVTLDDINLTATLSFNKGETITLNDALIEIDGYSIYVTPNDTVSVQEIDTTSHNITPLFDLIDENGNITASLKVGNVDGLVNFNAKTLALDASLNGVNLKFIDEILYVEYNGLKAKLAISDLNSITEKLSPLGLQIPDVQNLADIDTSNVLTELVSSLTTVESANELIVSTTILGQKASIVLTTDENGYHFSSVKTTIENNEIELSFTDQTAEIIPEDQLCEYNDVASLLDIISDNEINLSANVFDLDVDLCVNLVDFSILAKTEVYGKPLTAKFENNLLYISYLGLNAYVDVDDVPAVLEKLAPVIGELNIQTPNVQFSVQDVINSIVVNENNISCELFGFKVDVVLDATNNEFTVKQILVSNNDLSLLATPSARADFSALDDKIFNNLVSLLDIIDRNGNISVTANAFGKTFDVTLNVCQMKAYVGLDGLEVYIDLNTLDVYARYSNVKFKTNANELEYLLDTLAPIINKFAPNADLSNLSTTPNFDLDVEKIISDISVTEQAGVITLSINLDGVSASFNLSTNNQELKLASAIVNAMGTEIKLTPKSELNVYDFDLNETYLNVKDIVTTFTPALETVLTAENLSASMSASLTMKNMTFNLKTCTVQLQNIYGATKVNANLVLDIVKANTDGSTVTNTHAIRLVYLDPSLVETGATNVYFTYDDTQNTDVIEGSFTTTKASETLEIVKQLYQAIPELQDALYPLVIADNNGNPTLADASIDLKTIFNNVIFSNGVLSINANGTSINSNLNDKIPLELSTENETLVLSIPELQFGGATLSLNASVGAPENGSFTDDEFSYTPSENTMDFSSINELLLTLKNTSQYRNFQINAKVDVNAISILNIENKINIDIKIDVIDGKTYVKATLTRQHYDFLGIQAWKDWEGTSTLYYNPENQMIYINHEYYKIKGSIFKYKGDFASHKESYPVSEFTADPLTKILNIIRFSSTIENLIIDSTKEQKTSYATIDNSLKGYSYDATNKKFALTIDLEPLMGDIKLVNVNIGHNDNMVLNSLSAQADVLGALTLKLNATLSSVGQYLGVDTEVKSKI